jgi:tetratricopeptide (TPR) repeat protein
MEFKAALKVMELMELMKAAVIMIQLTFLSVYLTHDASADVPVHPHKNYELGLFELSERRYKSAVEQFDKVLADEPHNCDALVERGVSKEKLKDYKGAMSDFNSAMAFKHNGALFHRAELEYKLGDYQLAVDDYSRLLDTTPISGWHAKYLHGRALAEKRLNRSKQASEDFAKEKSFLGPPGGIKCGIKKKLTKPAH